MGIHGFSNSSKVRNIYSSKHKVRKHKRKQQLKQKTKLKFQEIQPEEMNELVSGVQFRNKRWKTVESGVPISGKRRRKLLKSVKRKLRQQAEDEKPKAALEEVEMKDPTKKKRKGSTVAPSTPMEVEQSN